MEILSRVLCSSCNKITLALRAFYLKLVSGMWSGQFSCVRVRYGLEGGETLQHRRWGRMRSGAERRDSMGQSAPHLKSSSQSSSFLKADEDKGILIVTAIRVCNTCGRVSHDNPSKETSEFKYLVDLSTR